MTEQYLSPKELSEHLDHKISPKTLANWRSAGRGPRYRRVGNKILYAMSWIEEWEATGVDWSPKSKQVQIASRRAAEPPAVTSPPAAAAERQPAQAPAAPSAEQPLVTAPAGTPAASPVAELVAARDDVRLAMKARQEAIRRMAARLDRHYSRRIDLVRGRLAGTAHVPAQLTSAEVSSD
jgi:pyruvate/2-oxoglutarate dehydrogenase complex dihydrolipoamide acyltransferase (E2) component